MRKSFQYTVLGSMIVWLVTVGAAYAEDWETIFPEARLIDTSAEQNADYRLALGPLKKVNNEWQFQRERRLSGKLQRRTLEIADRLSADEAYQHLRRALLRRDARPLYTCSGLDCGSSNAWAIQHFAIKQLYGLDQKQYYAAWEVPSEDDEIFYLATYVVQRGNKRVYAQIEHLEVPAAEQGGIVASPVTLVESLQQQGFFTLSGIDWSGEAVSVEREHLEAIVDALRHDPWLNIRIVGHDYGAGDLAQQQQRSETAARQVRKALLDMNIKPERITAHGVGSLAPARKRGSARIEVVAAQ